MRSNAHVTKKFDLRNSSTKSTSFSVLNFTEVSADRSEIVTMSENMCKMQNSSFNESLSQKSDTSS